MALLPESALAISDGGVVESLSSFGPDGVLCSSFLLHARVPRRACCGHAELL